MCTLEKRGDLFILTLTGDGEHRLNPTLIDSIQSALNQIRADPTSSSSALITTSQGKFFSNGYDLSWAGDSQPRNRLMVSKFRSLIADFLTLPMPTIAAVTGHASAGGFILAISHDYIVMRKDRGFLYMSELDIKLKPPAWFFSLVESRVGGYMARRAVFMRAAKLTAEMAVELNIVDSAHDGVEETVKAAIKLGEELVARKWDGHVYGQIRVGCLDSVFEKIGFDETVDAVRSTGSKL